jgi:Ulp1 family protease
MLILENIFLTRLAGQHFELPGNPQSVSGWIQKINKDKSNLLDYEEVYIPANYNLKHWFLIHINTICKSIRVYDSLGEKIKPYLN